MPKRKQKDKGVVEPEAKKRKMNWSGSEMEVLLQEVEKYKSVLFCSVVRGTKGPQKPKYWALITNAVNVVSAGIRMQADVKKKWFDMKSMAKQHISQYRRETLVTGGGQGPSQLGITEMDERIAAIIGETALSGVASTGNMDSDLTIVTVPSSPLSSRMSDPEGELVCFVIYLYYIYITIIRSHFSIKDV